VSEQKRKYFGTDGIRGTVGQAPITPDFVMKLGWAAGRVLTRGSTARNKVLIGKDTRVSGYMFESALEAGLAAAGVDTYLLGPMPTPGVAYLTRTFNAQAGIVISASHNKFEDNGIKFFCGNGSKLPFDVECAIEKELEQPMESVTSRELGKAHRVTDAAGRYIEFCKSTFSSDANLTGLKIVVDCAHGATYHIAPVVMAELGANVIALGDKPDGFNINNGFGATCPATLQQTVLAERADAGIALDGDGDRLIMVDSTGAVVDGDELTFIIAHHRHQRGSLRGAVVGTQMSNLGFERAVRALGIDFTRVNVGDRNILEMLQANHWDVGGEPSGHIICLDLTTTGDGIISALQTLEAMVRTGHKLSVLKAGMNKFPQRLINVGLGNGQDVMNCETIAAAIADAERRLGDTGRILIRASGTEPVIRVMVEGQDAALVDELAEFIADIVEQVVGAGDNASVVELYKA
tara:strand:- start:3073 stop:4464 length:1392 start_codon:yes stop_codon:yes gene_type:complete